MQQTLSAMSQRAQDLDRRVCPKCKGFRLVNWSSKMAAKRALKKAKPARVFGQGQKPKNAPRVSLYARVSTHDQQTLPLQLDLMRSYAARRGWSIISETQGVGSGAVQRPERELLMEAARRRELDIILVWRLDRWRRSVADLALTLKELNELGVALVSLTEALDLTMPTGRAMAGLLSVFAEFEREVLRERIIAGLVQARQKERLSGGRAAHFVCRPKPALFLKVCPKRTSLVASR